MGWNDRNPELYERRTTMIDEREDIDRTTCNICEGTLDTHERSSLESSGYDPEDESWCCSNCAYIHFK